MNHFFILLQNSLKMGVQSKIFHGKFLSNYQMSMHVGFKPETPSCTYISARNEVNPPGISHANLLYTVN